MSDSLSSSLKAWIEENLPAFLTNLPVSDSEPWQMPIVEDYVLIVAVKDYSDGGGGVFSIYNDNTAPYRLKGLLAEALD